MKSRLMWRATNPAKTNDKDTTVPRTDETVSKHLALLRTADEPGSKVQRVRVLG